MRKKHGTSVVFPSDEFYLTAKRKRPDDAFYEDYAQIENGVGMLTALETEFDAAYRDEDLTGAKPEKLLIPTGTDLGPFMKSLMRGHPIPGVDVEVVPIENSFFGREVTVTGLLTGADLLRGLAGHSADRALITECLLRDMEDVFLDDMPLDEFEQKLGIPVTVVGRRGDQLLDALMNRESCG